MNHPEVLQQFSKLFLLSRLAPAASMEDDEERGSSGPPGHLIPIPRQRKKRAAGGEVCGQQRDEARKGPFQKFGMTHILLE